MAADVCVAVDGAALASLLTDAACADGDVAGILFGAVRVTRTSRVTDDEPGARPAGDAAAVYASHADGPRGAQPPRRRSAWCT